MDILRDIAEIVENDTEHMVEVKIAYDGVTVYLNYDPDHTFEDGYTIPIHYDTIESYTYIPNDELVQMFHPNDYGIDLNEITIIKDIMEYFKSHSNEINDICSEYDLETRKDRKIDMKNEVHN